MTSTVRIPGHVRTVPAAGGGSILLDQRTGRCYAMNGVARKLWLAWERTGDFERALAVLAAGRPAGEKFVAECRTWAQTLLARGLIVAGPSTSDIDGRAGAGPSRPAEPCSPRLLRWCALLVLPVVLALVRLPFGVTVGLLGRPRRWWCHRAVTPAEAEAAVRAFGAVARSHPGRLACLELSLGAVLVLALTRRRLALVIGVADDPCRFHAWVDPGERPVNHQSDVDLAVFRPITVL